MKATTSGVAVCVMRVSKTTRRNGTLCAVRLISLYGIVVDHDSDSAVRVRVGSCRLDA